MKRIDVDFNRLNSTPIGVINLAPVGRETDEGLPPIEVGEHVVLWEPGHPGIEVEATVALYEDRYWVAKPIDETWHDIVA